MRGDFWSSNFESLFKQKAFRKIPRLLGWVRKPCQSSHLRICIQARYANSEWNTNWISTRRREKSRRLFCWQINSISHSSGSPPVASLIQTNFVSKCSWQRKQPLLHQAKVVYSPLLLKYAFVCSAIVLLLSKWYYFTIIYIIPRFCE